MIRPGDFQYMAAGAGVVHSEFNHSPIEPVHLLQVWIRPSVRGATPRYAERPMQTAEEGRLHLVASGDGREGSIALHQDADLWLARLRTGDWVEHSLAPGRGAWVHVAEGTVKIGDRELAGGDAVAFEGEPLVRIQGTGPAQVLVFDLA